jgi:hypothetical protein
LQLIGARGDGDGFSRLAHLHGDVEALSAARLDRQVSLLRSFEARRFRFQRVVAGRNGGEGVGTVLTRFCAALVFLRSLTSVTIAPRMIAPCGSLTVPRNVALPVVCATAGCTFASSQGKHKDRND